MAGALKFWLVTQLDPKLYPKRQPECATSLSLIANYCHWPRRERWLKAAMATEYHWKM